jgi:pimeloyl-ACP methyl ester carboxylesterase
MREIAFMSAGVECAAWHLPAATDELGGECGRPCVVMAHGFGGTRDTALLPYAQGFAEAGLDVLLFDYRGFGASAGTPRQRVSYRRQRADYRAAIAAARGLPGIDAERIVLWGTSYAGGHVVAVAAGDPGVAAVISLTPAMDGLAALAAVARHGGPRRLATLVGNGLRDALRAATGRAPHLVPVAGPAGSRAIIAKDGAQEAYSALAGPTWRNEVCARAALTVAINRPIRFAGRLRRPLLIQVGEADTVAPPAAAEAAAMRAGEWAELRRYPVDHFDVYAGSWQQRARTDQLQFLRRHLAGRAIFDNERVGV